MRVKCLTQKQNTGPWRGLEPGRLDAETHALTMRPPSVPPQWALGYN